MRFVVVLIAISVWLSAEAGRCKPGSRKCSGSSQPSSSAAEQPTEQPTEQATLSRLLMELPSRRPIARPPGAEDASYRQPEAFWRSPQPPERIIADQVKPEIFKPELAAAQHAVVQPAVAPKATAIESSSSSSGSSKMASLLGELLKLVEAKEKPAAAAPAVITYVEPTKVVAPVHHVEIDLTPNTRPIPADLTLNNEFLRRFANSLQLPTPHLSQQQHAAYKWFGSNSKAAPPPLPPFSPSDRSFSSHEGHSRVDWFRGGSGAPSDFSLVHTVQEQRPRSASYHSSIESIPNHFFDNEQRRNPHDELSSGGNRAIGRKFETVRQFEEDDDEFDDDEEEDELKPAYRGYQQPRGASSKPAISSHPQSSGRVTTGRKTTGQQQFQQQQTKVRGSLQSVQEAATPVVKCQQCCVNPPAVAPSSQPSQQVSQSTSGHQAPAASAAPSAAPSVSSPSSGQAASSGAQPEQQQHHHQQGASSSSSSDKQQVLLLNAASPSVATIAASPYQTELQLLAALGNRANYRV